MNGTAVRPRRFWYWVAGAILVVTGVTAGAVAGVTIGTTVRAVQTFDVGRWQEVELVAGETHTLYTNAARRLYGPLPVRCLVDGGGLPQPRLERDEGSTVHVNERRWISFAKVTASADGSYRIRCFGPPFTRVAVGPDLGSIMLGLALAGLIGFVGLVVAITVATVTAVRRRSARRALAPPPTPAPPAPPAPPGWASPPPGPATGTPPSPPGR